VEEEIGDKGVQRGKTWRKGKE